MQKIVSLFARNYDGDGLVRDEVVPGAEWVAAGEGVATRKFDGTCCLVRGGQLFKRYDAKKAKPLPPGFEPAQDPDPITRHWPGWVPVGPGPEDRWHREAWANQNFDRPDGPPVRLPDGTYELLGPKVQGNPEREYVEAEVGLGKHLLVPHGRYLFADAPRTFAALREWLAGQDIEGVVWHHPDGRMVKAKKKDFGQRRG